MTSIKVPAWAQPKVQYGICVVTRERAQGRRAGVREARAEHDGPGEAARGRLPAARQAKKLSAARKRSSSRTSQRRCVAFAFLLLPIVAIFARTSPAHLVDQLSNPVVTDALVVTLKTSLLAQTVHRRVRNARGVPAREPALPGHALAVTLVELPLVLPPAVAGIALLAAFGRLGLLGSSLSALGISLPFTQTAVTMAVAYVASPLYIRQAIAAFEATDPNLAAASRTLGAGPPHVLPRRRCRSRAAA